MAEVQESGPIIGLPLDDDTWRSLLGDEAAVIGDTDGTAYGITLPPASDSVELGSATIDSTARVGGFLHKIPAGTTQSLNIPASTNAPIGRTDLIVARLDLATWGSASPGPVRLYRIAGVEGSAAVPTYDPVTPGVEDLPLWTITRKQGQALTQASVTDLRVRSGPSLLVPTDASLPSNLPLGSRARRDGVEYAREMVASLPQWEPVNVTGVRPLYVRGRTSGLAMPANTQQFFHSANISGSAGDWSPHIGITPSASGDTGDVWTLNTAGLYTVESWYYVIVAGAASPPAPAGTEGGYHIQPEITAGGVEGGSGAAADYLPFAFGTANPYSSDGAPQTFSRYFEAGTKIRWRIFCNAGGTLQSWYVSVMRLAD